jgi:hypothetical protein
MGFSNWLPWTAGAFGNFWRARPGDTGLDVDAGERITRGVRMSYQNAPVPVFNLHPVTGIVPLYDEQWLRMYATAKYAYGPLLNGSPQGAPVVQTLSLPKQKAGAP